MEAPVHPNEPHPRFLKIQAAATYCGIGRSRLYLLARGHPGLFRKNGRATIVDLEMLDRILDALPAARLGARAA